MGTTTANKHGLRKAAQERTKKHAQRTPLPPKDGVEKVGVPEYAEAYGRMTQPQLRKALFEKFGQRSANDCPKGKLLEVILKKEREARASAPAPEPRPSKKASAPVESRSAAKAAPIQAIMEANGWESSLLRAEGTEEADDEMELEARRGDETLWISWTKGVLTTEPMPSYTIGDRTIKLRNASAVKQYAVRAPDAGAKELQKVVENKFFKKRAPEPSTIKRSKLPFDPESASESEIIDALMGKAVAWHNRLRETPETAIVGKNVRRIHFTEFGGERIFNFLCPQGGFKAFRLVALLKVGSGKVHKSKGETVVVEVE